MIALLGGCGDGGALGDSTTVTGQIQAWTQGAATLDLQVLASSQPLSSAPVDSTGHFSVILPGSSALSTSRVTPDFSLGHGPCEGTVAVSPATALSTQALFEVSVTGKTDDDTYTDIGDVLLSATAPGKMEQQYALSILYAYFSEDASASGTLSCGPWSTTVHVDVSQGWNTLRAVSLGYQVDVSSGPPPSAAVWTSDLFDVGGDECTSDDDCGLDICDLSEASCTVCVISGNQAESSVDCCNPTAEGTGNVLCK